MNKGKIILDINHFNELPDNLSEKELQFYFNLAIEYFENTMEVNPTIMSEALYELAVRQWHIYKHLDSNTKGKIDLIVSNLIDANSYDLMDNIASVIAYLGLEKSFQVLKELVERDDVNNDVRQLLVETIGELEGNVHNPYSGLE